MHLKSKLLSILSIFICANAFADNNISHKLTNSVIQKLWEFKIDATSGKTYINQDGTVYAISQNQTNTRLYAIAGDGKEKWHFDLPNQNYASPCIDIYGNVNIYGQDMSLTSISPSGTVKWRINLPSAKNEVANTDIPLVSGQFTSLIYATTSQGRFFIIHPSGVIGHIYTPLVRGTFVAPPKEWYEGSYVITYAMNLDKSRIGLDIAEIHKLIANNDSRKVEDKTVASFKGTIKSFEQAVYSKIMYIILNQKNDNSLMALHGSTTLWSRPLKSENTKLVQREDDLPFFKKIYYTDIEDNKNVVFGIDVTGKVIFKADLNVNSTQDIFAYKTNLITVNQSSDAAIQNITVLDRSSGKELCSGTLLTSYLLHANSDGGKVYLLSTDGVRAFQPCA